MRKKSQATSHKSQIPKRKTIKFRWLFTWNFVHNISFVVFFFFFPSFRLHPQSYYFKNYTESDGLAGDKVLSVFQDSKSNLWIGTNGGGVSKFNGSSFSNYNFNNGLPGNLVPVITEDASGNIWVGTDEGLAQYDGKKFTVFKIKDGLVNDFINCICRDRKDNFWIGTKGGVTLVKFNWKNNGKPYLRNFTSKEGLIGDDVKSIVEDTAGGIWFGTGKGITLFSEKSGSKWGNLVKYLTVADGLLSNDIKKIFLDNRYNIVVTTNDGGVFRYLPGEREKGNKSFIPLVSDCPACTDNTIGAIIQDHKGSYWLAIRETGLIKVIPSVKAGERSNMEIITPYHGLENNNIGALFEDSEENIWLGTSGSGITRFSGKRFETFTKQHGIIDNFIWTIAQTSDSDIWIGCDAGGISKLRYNPSEKNYGIFSYTAKNGLTSDRVYMIIKDTRENLWLATDNGLVYLALNDAGEPEKFFTYYKKDGLYSNRIRSLLFDKKGNLWVGYYGGGVELVKILYNGPAAPGVKAVPVDNNILKNFMVYHMFQDRDNNIWFATGGGGVLRLNPANIDAVSSAFASYSYREGLASDDVRMITEDNAGNLWFSTGNGISMYRNYPALGNDTLSAYTGKDVLFENLTFKDGISSSRTYSLIFDSDSNLWIGTDFGIDRFDYKRYISSNEKIFKHYGYMDGFTGIETNSTAVLRDAGNNLWFGTIGGLIKYNPTEDKYFVGESPVYITDMSVFMEYKELENNLELPFNQNNVTFDFIAINLTSPEKVRYQYQLAGFDRQWSPLTAETYVNYSYLPPGSYTFLVRARNSEGVWSKNPATYSFNIIPPIWFRWWFFSLCGLAFILFIYFLIRARLRNMKRIALMLREQVELRTKELKQEKEKVEEQNRMIETRNKNILSGIHYAGRIQEAILPVQEKFKSLVPQSFILYRPRDVVSGDFYWFSKKDRKVLFAAVDCTGHGVPGAFMSLIGNNLLDHIVNHSGVTNPSEIILELHSELVDALKKYENESPTLEGMEIALCTYDDGERVLEFASAKRALIFIRSGNIELFKSGHYPVGLVVNKQRKFPTVTFHVQPNDTFYIFTDGICDQFGGVTGRKFMMSRLNRLLMDIQVHPMEEQKTLINNAFDEWKTGWPQIDDVLVMGVRF